MDQSFGIIKIKHKDLINRGLQRSNKHTIRILDNHWITDDHYLTKLKSTWKGKVNDRGVNRRFLLILRLTLNHVLVNQTSL